LGGRVNAADTKTLRFIAQSDLRVLDPIWTTAYNDTLFAPIPSSSRILR